MNDKAKKYVQWIPALITLLAAIVTVIIVVATGMKIKTAYYAVIAVSVVVAVGLTALNAKFKLQIPLFVVSAVCLHTILSTDLASALNFNVLFPWWDMLCHGMFGCIYCMVILCLYKRFQGGNPNVFGLISIFLIMLGLAALWEVYEFLAGAVLDMDMQGVQEALSAGYNPLFDTMTDIMIAIAGAAVFYATYFIDRKTGDRLYSFSE